MTRQALLDLAARLREGVLIRRIPQPAFTLIEPGGKVTEIAASYSEIRQGPSLVMTEAADALEAVAALA